MPPHPVDIAVALFASRQAGNFSIAQARSVGADDGLIWRRRRSGRWLSAAPAVVSLPAFPDDARSRLWVGMLDAGPAAMASHESAAALHGIDSFHLSPPSILVPHGTHHLNAVATVHQTRAMPAPVILGGIPTTPIVRTLVDLAATTPPVRLGRAIDQAVVSKGASLPAIGKGLEWMQRTRRPGAVNLSRALDGRTHGYVPSRSELERLLDAIIATLPCDPPEHEVDLPSHPIEWEDLARDAEEVRAELFDLLGLVPHGGRSILRSAGATRRV